MPISYDLMLFAGNANRPLAEAVAKVLNLPLADALVGRFSDGEIRVEIKSNVRGADVFIVQPTGPPVNDNLMELLIMVDALRRASAQRVTAVVPYYGYSRQDRKPKGRVPISAKLVADLLAASGINRLLTVDLHAGQIQGFFSSSLPVDNLFGAPLMVDYIRKLNLPNPVIVSPDAGGTQRARSLAKALKAGLAVIDKRRDGPNVATFMHLIGDVNGKEAVIVDDICDTAGTLCEAVRALRREGATRVFAMVTHGLLSGPAVERLREVEIDEMVISDTMLVPEEKRFSKLRFISVAPLIADAIRRIHDEESVSVLFEENRRKSSSVTE